MDSEYLKQLMPYFLLMAGMIVFGIISWYITAKNNQKRRSNYLEKYPNAVKVYPKMTNVIVANSQIMIHMVDGEAPVFKGGAFYVKPGKSVLSVSFESERVGFFYKKVRTYTDRISIEVDLEPGKDYVISFDKKAESFRVDEKN